MPRTPKSTNGATGPASPRSTKKTRGRNGAARLSADDVARRAYELFESRGRQHGADFDDWIAAEHQLTHDEPPSPPPAGRRRSRTAGSA